jgi:hypothetical protein
MTSQKATLDRMRTYTLVICILLTSPTSVSIFYLSAAALGIYLYVHDHRTIGGVPRGRSHGSIL